MRGRVISKSLGDANMCGNVSEHRVVLHVTRLRQHHFHFHVLMACPISSICRHLAIIFLGRSTSSRLSLRESEWHCRERPRSKRNLGGASVQECSLGGGVVEALRVRYHVSWRCCSVLRQKTLHTCRANTTTGR